MNETANWTEEDASIASWINFRLTIQQVSFKSGSKSLNIYLNCHVFDQQKYEQVYDAEAMWVTPESFHCLMIIYSSLIICEYSLHSAIPEYSIQCFSVLVTVGSLGNLLVLATILRSSEMRTARNVLIGNLALSDLCLCVVTMPLTLVSEDISR